MNLDYIIVGAGFAGVVMAERIANVLGKNVVIVERRNHIGGNCYDYLDENGILIHKYGPHLFHTDSKEVFQYLSQFTEWDLYNHKVLAYIDGNMVPLPFNFNSLHKVFPNTLACSIEKKLLERYRIGQKIPILEFMKSDDYELKFLAEFVYEKVFLNYTAKQWGLQPDEIDAAVTARVPVLIGKDDRYFNDKYQGVPMYGYTKLFEKMLCHNNIKQLLNTDAREVLSIDGDKIEFFGSEFKGKLIFTGQLDELFNNKFGELPYRSTDMKFETVDAEWYQTVATENYPNNYDFTRITEFKRIHTVNSKRTTILKEYPQKYVAGINVPYYPVFTDECQIKYNQYSEYVNNNSNIILLGRLAEYKYYDMDDMVHRAMEVFKSEFANDF